MSDNPTNLQCPLTLQPCKDRRCDGGCKMGLVSDPKPYKRPEPYIVRFIFEGDWPEQEQASIVQILETEYGDNYFNDPAFNQWQFEYRQHGIYIRRRSWDHPIRRNTIQEITAFLREYLGVTNA